MERVNILFFKFRKPVNIGFMGYIVFQWVLSGREYDVIKIIREISFGIGGKLLLE
jgi:hypothetical protein